MPLGKNSRPGKRPAPSSSYLSTITTVGFVALCVFGVWMLTSSSVVPSERSAGDGGGDSLSSGSRLGKSAERYEEADLTEEQDRIMSALGRPSGSSGKAYGDDGDSVAKTEEKQEAAEEEEKNQVSGGEQETLVEDRGAEGAAAGEGKEQGQEQTDGQESQQQSVENVESQQQQQVEANEEGKQPQAEVNEENQQQQLEGNEESQKQNPQQQSEGNEDSLQTQSTVTEDEIDQTRERPADSGTSDGGQRISQQGQAQEQEQQQEQEEQQQQQEHEHEQQQQQQAESGEEQQKDNKRSEESGEGHESSELQSQQQPDGKDNNDGQQQSATEPQQERQNFEQQQAAGEEGNVENTPREQKQEQPHEGQGQAQEQAAESNAPENQEQTGQSDDGNAAAGSNTQPSDEPLTEPHVGDSIPKETRRQQHQGSAWSTQAGKSETENERQESLASHAGAADVYGHTWELCNATAGPDYIPCLDNEKAVRRLRNTKHYEHRERHCPEESPSCLVPLPQGYKLPIEWPQSRGKVKS